MSVTNILLLEQHLMPAYAHQPNLRPTNTLTNKKDTVCLMTSARNSCVCPYHLQPTKRFFSNSHHDECTSFLITQLPKNKRKLIPLVLRVHITEFNRTYLQQVHKINTNLSHSMNELAPIALWFSFKSHVFIWAVGFSNHDNCCQSQRIGKSIKGIFRVD